MPFCLIEGHKSNEITSICTFKGCQYAYRQTCQDCINELLHQHGYKAAPYLITIEQFKNKLDNFVYPWGSKIYLEQIENIIKDVLVMFEWIKKQIECQEISQQNKKDKWQISQLNDMIHIFNISQDLPDFAQFISHLESVKINLQLLQDGKNQPKDHIYELVPYNNSNYFRDCDKIHISEDEKFLGLRKKMNNLETDYQFRIISMPKIRSLCSNTKNVGQFFVSFAKDPRCVILYTPKCIYVYSVQNLKLLFKLNFDYFIYDIKWINWNTVLIATNKVIMVFDIIQKKALIKINESQLNMLDYDSNNDQIIGSQGSKIHFFERMNGNSLGNFKMDYDIKKIQFTGQGKYLFIVYKDKIIKYKVDAKLYRMLYLQSLPVKCDQLIIDKFDSMVFTLLSGELKILNDQLQILHTLKFCAGSKLIQASLNYIFLMSGDSQNCSILKNRNKSMCKKIDESGVCS